MSADLQKAAVLIEQHMATLDRTGAVCEGCKRFHYRNWEQQQQYSELQAIARKLRRYAGKEKGTDNESIDDESQSPRPTGARRNVRTDPAT